MLTNFERPHAFCHYGSACRCNSNTQKCNQATNVQNPVLASKGYHDLIKSMTNLKSPQTTYNSEKCKKYDISFPVKTALFRRDFQALKTREARTALSSNGYHFYKPKSSCFMRETPVKRISFFLEFLMLYEVYVCVRTWSRRQKTYTPHTT